MEKREDTAQLMSAVAAVALACTGQLVSLTGLGALLLLPKRLLNFVESIDTSHPHVG